MEKHIALAIAAAESEGRMRIKVDEGKYTFFKNEDDYRVQILRYDQDWVTIEAGCNAVISLMNLVEELEPVYRGIIEYFMDDGSFLYGHARIAQGDAVGVQRVRDGVDFVSYRFYCDQRAWDIIQAEGDRFKVTLDSPAAENPPM